ncbi:DUF4906 domain-containing protein [Parabacteroides gordonii]|uniref:DUF4906 domain-containing protein n=1 Tax=Parabacteroides gordonii MS-1 = DSM 23371 TaxID=1203610 RepID=A0A0F5IZN1_9BACT|nr:DUF4906 domain-containing protein [Parabacteroides gordonii]KKB50647.1 hypothetical protein HMPREF1536_04186 [Parabacteroides gordonii MS-1 = DSM 23371]MCA5585402.1 DUF4906 domain-containing protein [Parabacteroides gordonii]RGP16425.1 DUF4906 domain-containing protein [Parabacteroides gordonii]
MKNKIIVYVPVLLTFISCLFTTGCSSSEEDTSNDGFRFCVQQPQSIDVETKAVLGDASESTEISNAWIVQYNSGSDNILNCRYITDGFTGKENGYLLEIKTADDAFSKIASDFYIILIYRAYAKLTLNVKFPTNSNDFFEVSEATITNIPKNMALYAGGGGNANYPDINDIETDPIILSSVSTNGGPVSFYMPENIRGTGSSLTFQGKNIVSNGPGGNLNGCTYLTLKGKYYYNKTQSGGNYVQDPIDVEYRFYLGSNLTNDYNIRRDHHYKLTVNITGANSADLRVTITNGNVAVFDEVETIENKVDF